MAHETTGSNGAAADVEMVEASELRRRSKPGDRVNRDGEGAVPAEEEAASVERAFAGQRVPSWREQLTVRAFVVSFFLAVMFSVIVMKLNLTTGIIPSLNVSAGLLGFFLLTSWTRLLEKAGVPNVRPFTRQENTVVQTCVVACSGIAFSGMYVQ